MHTLPHTDIEVHSKKSYSLRFSSCSAPFAAPCLCRGQTEMPCNRAKAPAARHSVCQLASACIIIAQCTLSSPRARGRLFEYHVAGSTQPLPFHGISLCIDMCLEVPVVLHHHSRSGIWFLPALCISLRVGIRLSPQLFTKCFTSAATFCSRGATGPLSISGSRPATNPSPFKRRNWRDGSLFQTCRLVSPHRAIVGT